MSLIWENDYACSFDIGLNIPSFTTLKNRPLFICDSIVYTTKPYEVAEQHSGTSKAGSA